MILIGQFFWINVWMCDLSFCHMLSLFSVLGISASAILLIKLKQLSTVLYFPYKKDNKGRYTPSTCLRYFTKHYTTTMAYVFKGNRIYGKAILLFIASNLPFNMFLLAYILNSQMSHAVRLYIGVFVIEEYCCMFGNHYIATMFCRTIHQPSKRLLKLDVLVKSFNTRDHLKLCHYIQMLHTNNQYGITYGSVLGLITVNKFLKVKSTSKNSLNKISFSR